MDEAAVYFLQDFARLLYDRAEQARDECARLSSASNSSEEGRDFACGHTLAYYEVVSLFVHTAQVFGLSADLVPLVGIDPDDLLK